MFTVHHVSRIIVYLCFVGVAFAVIRGIRKTCLRIGLGGGVHGKFINVQRLFACYFLYGILNIPRKDSVLKIVSNCFAILEGSNGLRLINGYVIKHTVSRLLLGLEFGIRSVN